MTTVQIYHAEPFHGGFGPPPKAFTHVAEVDAGGVPGGPLGALEYAYVRTQNLHGSWSMGAQIGGRANGDFSPFVKRLAPLHESGGRTYGLRSSSMGDVFVIDGAAYVVASFGFEPLPEDWPHPAELAKESQQ